MSNEFEELEECALKTKLTELLNKHGYTIRKIEVMKASERTTKSNAYFTGTGKTKTILFFVSSKNKLFEGIVFSVKIFFISSSLYSSAISE